MPQSPQKAYDAREMPPPSMRGSKDAASISRILPIILLYSLIIPAGINFTFGTVLLYPFRIILLISMPIVAMEMARTRLRPMLADYLVLIAAGWLFIATIYNLGFGNGIESASREAIDFAMGYFVARACIRSGQDVVRLLWWFLPGFLFIAAIFAFESISHKLVLFPLFPHFTKTVDSISQVRLGLMRARGPFPHPIHGGLFLASFLPLYFVLAGRAKKRLAGILAACTAFFSLSSAAILALLLSIALTAYAWLASRLYGRINWFNLLIPLVTILVLLELVTESGVVKLIIRYFSISPGTGYYRLLIWEYGSEAVRAKPLFGVAYGGYERVGWMRTGSVDNHWLALAIRFGIVVPVVLLGAVVMAMWNLSKARKWCHPQDRWITHGLTITLFATSACLWTVFAWLQVQVWFMMLIGMSVSLSQTLVAQAAFARRLSMRGTPRSGIGTVQPADQRMRPLQ